LGNDIAAQLIAINNRIDTTNNRITALDTDTQSALQDLSISISNYINRTNTKLEEVTDLVNTETNRATAAEQALAERITQVEENPGTPKDSIKHLFMTQAEYDALESYERDTLYFILETSESHSHFGDTFPLILG
jgi:predicted  nucleic acid-binding Zn-ribbon protein